MLQPERRHAVDGADDQGERVQQRDVLTEERVHDRQAQEPEGRDQNPRGGLFSTNKVGHERHRESVRARGRQRTILTGGSHGNPFFRNSSSLTHLGHLPGRDGQVGLVDLVDLHVVYLVYSHDERVGAKQGNHARHGAGKQDPSNGVRVLEENTRGERH